ncbi:hypothetical protein DAQ1742_02548 [Dickeya aquatica]|uniref:Uncharacterized protein n=1 Tax=Dickeya aquatica TaxID=1401087 RepID=A0A375ABY0_9GAMM|nr:hypothetical protein DAQ1742_02548 [Dickeya aquatica]
MRFLFNHGGAQLMTLVTHSHAFIPHAAANHDTLAFGK